MNLAYAATPDTKTFRDKNRKDRAKQHAIDRVKEALDVFSVVLVVEGIAEYDIADHQARYEALRRAHATQIVNAVEALLKDRS